MTFAANCKETEILKEKIYIMPCKYGIIYTIKNMGLSILVVGM